MKRTVEDACPYRGLDDFRLFVRRRKVVRTRIRTPHPSAFGCHLPHWGRLLISANNVTALNEISFVGEAFRLPFCKQAARTNKMAAYQTTPYIVGAIQCSASPPRRPRSFSYPVLPPFLPPLASPDPKHLAKKISLPCKKRLIFGLGCGIIVSKER